MHGTSQAVPVALTTMGGLVTLAGPDSLPEGASPRCYDNAFGVGSTYTRDGLTNVYSYSGSSIGPSGPSQASSTTWTNPEAVVANDGTYASIIAPPPNVNQGGHFASISPPPPDALNISGFGFNVPSTDTPTGIIVTVYGFSNSNAQLTVFVSIGGVIYPIDTYTLPSSSQPVIVGSLNSLFGIPLTAAALNNTSFGVSLTATSAFSQASVFIDYVTIEVAVATGAANFNFIQSFTAQDGSLKNFALDANGDFWIEDVTNNPGVLTLGMEGIAPNSYAIGSNGPGVDYLAFCDGSKGSDMPRQYTPGWIDRITQVGPGAAPTFTPVVATSTQYSIVNITQPAGQSKGYSYFLQSGGPGSTAPGNVVTFYYQDSSNGTQDSDLVTAFNSGNPVYVYASFTGGPVEQGPYVVQVTSVGEGQPPGQPRQFYYFTFNVGTAVYTYYQGSGHSTYTANYQRTLATMTMSAPVPGLTVGNQATISGASVASYDNAWPISQTLNSGSMVIVSTQVQSGVATFSYALTTGVAPAAGELVTITGTTNVNGALNLVNATIASSTGGNSGSFTVGVSLPDNQLVAVPEDNALASTAGTIFDFDPGFPLLDTSTNPIYGTSTGGTLTFAGPSGQFISTGTKQGTVFFITRNGYYTAPAPPVTFDVPVNCTSIQVGNIPIGPANVVKRGIALTESGQLGVAGGNFFIIPEPVTYIDQNVSYTATATVINDNFSTTATLFFTDSVLLKARAIDVYGFNLFNQIELGDPGWIKSYDSRNFYGLCLNKIQNFNNLSFDGGYLPASRLLPLGWQSQDAYGSLVTSPIFGNSWYIQNTSDSTLSGGMISQTAYQDAYKQAIIYPNTLYSVRVRARIPSGNTTGKLVFSLTSNGNNVGSATFDFSDWSTSMKTIVLGMLTVPMVTVPTSLMLNVSATDMAPGADVEIDRFDVFPTDIPVENTTVYGSYAALPEQVDGVSGKGVFASENQEPVYGATVLYDTFYALKRSSRYSWQSVGNLEPSDWKEPEVAQKSGTCGIRAFDSGEQWDVSACRNGIYLFEGGAPGKIMQEIYQIWDAINWEAAETIWVTNDVPGQRLLVGIPLPTPNFWLPNAPVNNPKSPNVILALDYKGLDSGQDIKTKPQMHTTMFGTLAAVDMRRKWTLWKIAAPCCSIVQTKEDKAIYLGNGAGNSKVYMLDPNAATDDGTPIDSLYTTAAFGNPSQRQKFPQLGSGRVRWGYMRMTATNNQAVNVRLLPETILGPTDPTTGYYPWSVPGGFDPLPTLTRDREASLNFSAARTFVEVSGADFDLSGITLLGTKDVWNTQTGLK